MGTVNQTNLVRMLRERDDIVRKHHERSGYKLEAPFTLEGQAADEINRLQGHYEAKLAEKDQRAKNLEDLLRATNERTAELMSASSDYARLIQVEKVSRGAVAVQSAYERLRKALAAF